MWTSISQVLILAAIGEAVWETLKMVWQKEALANSKGKINPDKIGALAVAILIAFGARIDLFTLVGVPLSIPYLGYVLTGVLISRGSGFVHDLLTNLKSLKEIVLNKADTAKNEMEGSVKVSSKVASGTKISIDNSGAVSKAVSEEGESITNKIKATGRQISDAAARVIKVIRSTPTVKAEEENPKPSEDSSDTPKADDTGAEPISNETEQTAFDLKE